MRLGRVLLLGSLLHGPEKSAWADSSPETRTPTDPRSVVSAPNAQAHPVPIDDLYYTRTIFGAAWSPDGRDLAFTTDISGRLNLWKVRSSGGWPIQLTQSDDSETNATWSPDGKWIVYQEDRGGDEIYDLYAIPSHGGPAVNLTKTPEISESNPLFSPDGTLMAMNYKPKAGTAYDVALLDWKTRAVRNLTHETSKDHSWNPVVWSRDGKTLYANRGDVSATDGDVYRIDVGTGKAENLTPHKGQVVCAASSLSPDGKTLLVTSNEKGGYQNVAVLDVATEKLTWVTNGRWEAQSGDFSPNGKAFTYAINQDGQTDTFLVDRASLRADKIPLPEGLNGFSSTPSAFSPEGDRLLVLHQSSVKAPDYWVYDLGTRTTSELTYSAIASLAEAALPPAQIVHYKTFDGKIISALLWVPFNLRREPKSPALVLPHGGPTGQTVDYWNTEVTALVSRGYICIAPNVRGSTGYGAEFQKANYQDLGGGDLQDEVYATKFLEATGFVDPKRIGITGGSYGGFMTLMAIGKTPEIWAAAVEEYGIIDWYTMLKSSDPFLQEYEKSLLGDPEKDRKVYEATSPIKFIHNVRAPLLVLQGENDPRVPKEEAQQVVDLLKKDGKTIDVHYYAAEGHGFSKRENQIDAIKRTIQWFEEHMATQAP
jgi:dipeptidyl aminopeptidase/acylaminoacyl peptidase